MAQVLAFLAASWWGWTIALIVGIVVGVIYASFTEGRKIGITITLAIIALLLSFGVIAGLQSFVQVPYGSAGILVRFGGITGRVLEPGLQTKIPFVESIYKYPTVVKVYETSYNPDTTGADFPDYFVDSRTNDGQYVEIAYSVKFRIQSSNAADVLQNIGDLSKVIEQVIKDSRSLVREHVSAFTADDLYSAKGKVKFANDMRSLLRDDFSLFKVDFVDFLLREVTFSEEYQASIESKEIARQEAERANIVIEQRKNEAEQRRQEAQGLADSAVIKAQGDAQSAIIAAKAEAEAIEAKGQALKKYPEILQLNMIGQLGRTTMWLPSSGLEYLLPLPQTTP